MIVRDPEQIYLKLPIWLQNRVVALQGWRINRARYNAAFYEHLRAYEDRLTWDADRIREYRDQRIHAFVKHCEQTVPYYHNLFRECGTTSADINGLDDLAKLPILTKATVQDRYEDFLSSAVPPKERNIAHTSGTTGGGLRFATTAEALAEQWAVWWRYRRNRGIDIDTPCAYFGGRSVVPLEQTRPPFWRYNGPGKQVMFSGYHMSPENLPEYIDEMKRKRLPWLHGYPSLLTLLANYAIENDVSLGYDVKWITIGAENLLPHQADAIERAFGVRPFQHYGLAEAVANISEYEAGRLRVDEDFAAVEFLPNPDGGYKIVGTNFTNLATPLLRYDTGDVADIDEAGRPAGDGHRYVRAVDGRLEDYVVLKNGARLGRMDHIFKDLVRIREAQLYQSAPGVIEIRVVRGPEYTDADEKYLIQEFRKRVGDEADLDVQYVDALQRSKTGKLRFVVSDIGKI